MARLSQSRADEGFAPAAKGNVMLLTSLLSAPADIQPNTTGLPGIAALQKIVGAMLTIGLIAAVAGIAISAIAWAIGSHSSNPHVAGRGKTGVLISVAAAMVIGAANTLVSFFNSAGAAIQ